MVEDTKTKVIEGITEMVGTQEVIIKVQVVIKEVVEVINKPVVTNSEEVAIVVAIIIREVVTKMEEIMIIEDIEAGNTVDISIEIEVCKELDGRSQAIRYFPSV